MPRKAFYSFHYKPDNWRASKVRNMGVIEGNRLASDNDWESITQRGDSAIKKWIEEQMTGKSVVIVLIGENTSGRKWINHEIESGWNREKGLLGVYIHNLKDRNDEQSRKGANPFRGFTVGSKDLASVVKAYDPPHTNSQSVYNYIKNNLEDWIEEAIGIRKSY